MQFPFFCREREAKIQMGAEWLQRKGPVPVNGGFRMEGYWVWCGSVVKGEDGNYHMFASRWPKSLPMHPGWLVASEIVRAVSKTPEGPYEFAQVVLPARSAQYWDGRSTHNPHIKKTEDGYVLYYMGTTHPFNDVEEGEVLEHNDFRTISARANKRIGIATSKSIFGPWERRNQPILMPRPDHFDNFFTSNPAPVIEENGRVTMVYKTRTYAEYPYPKYLHGKMNFGVARADRYDGKYQAVSDVPLLGGTEYELEDPFIWKEDGRYHMIAKDMNGKVCGEAMGGVYGYSEDGVHWEFERGFLAYSRNVLWDDGIVREMGNLERPFVLFEDGRPTHMFFATSDGTDGEGFMKCENTWNMVIPLEP